MTGMREDLERKLHHPQPARVPDTHWSPDGNYLHPGVDPDACGSCKAYRATRCDTCEGSGVVDATPEGARHPAMQSDTECPTCDGTGERSNP